MKNRDCVYLDSPGGAIKMAHQSESQGGDAYGSADLGQEVVDHSNGDQS